MTPIFVRPVREQLEHDRLIRFLQPRYKRKFDVFANVGDQQLGAVKLGNNAFYPDLVLLEGKKLAGLVEVETVESTNNLEAMAQWTHFSRARVPFHLYVPVLAYDAARRLCDANQVAVSEIWTYRAVNDQFDLVRMFSDANALKTGNKLAPKAVFFVPEPPKVEPPPPPPPVVVAKPEVPVAKKFTGKSIIVASLGTPSKMPAGKSAVAVRAATPVAVPTGVVKAPAPVKSVPVNPVASAKAAKPSKPAPKKPAPKTAAPKKAAPKHTAPKAKPKAKAPAAKAAQKSSKKPIKKRK